MSRTALTNEQREQLRRLHHLEQVAEELRRQAIDIRRQHRRAQRTADKFRQLRLDYEARRLYIDERRRDLRAEIRQGRDQGGNPCDDV